MFPPQLRSLAGLAILVGIGWALSRDRKAISWRLVLWGLALQLCFGAVVLLTPGAGGFFGAVNDALLRIMGFSDAGAKFLFGDLVFNNIPVGAGTAGGNSPIAADTTQAARAGAYFAFHVLPTIVFFSSKARSLYSLL